MKKCMIDLIRRHREIVAFVVVGVVVTVLNWALYVLLTSLCGWIIAVSNMAAWFGAVVVAYFLNKTFVFKSRDWSSSVVLSEFLKFSGGRLFSGILETVLVVALTALGLGQEVFGISGFTAKFISSGIIMVVNFYLGKKTVFI